MFNGWTIHPCRHHPSAWIQGKLKPYLSRKFKFYKLTYFFSLQMEKDFMRSITVAIFVPMTFCELFNIYCEIVAYINLFSMSEEQYNHIYV